MGKITGFMEFRREMPARRPVSERIQDFRDVHIPLPVTTLHNQAARCMDCGVPFCQSGCPLGNIIPDWNDLVYHGKWREAWERLRATNNFPEFTGRICPAPCESACVLGINDLPVTIEEIERAIVEHAFESGWVQPVPPARRTGNRVAIVGSGPAGLACADQLNRAGHAVTVFERDDRVGGLLRYGIPDFKLEKWVLDRRLDIMRAEGIQFETRKQVGVDANINLDAYNAVVLCCGATKPRDLPIPGRDLRGIYFAWDYLCQQNKRVAGDTPRANGSLPVTAQGKHVVVIGGGDTGSDCVGTANRQGAETVTQFEVLSVPPETRPQQQPWPLMPTLLTTTSSHEEGVERHWSILTRSFDGVDGVVKRLITKRVERAADGAFEEIPGSEQAWPADLVLLAIGYTGPERGAAGAFGVALDEHGNVASNEAYMTSVPGIFAAGDMRRGQSLVVWAISEGREAAGAVDAYLLKRAVLPSKGHGDLPRV